MECRTIPQNVARTFVRADLRACVHELLLFIPESENVLAVETSLHCVFWLHRGTYGVHCAALKIHEGLLSFSVVRLSNTFPQEHWSQEVVESLCLCL